MSVWICGKDRHGKSYVRDVVREIVAERFPDFKIKELDAVVHCVRRKPKTEGAKK